jgi:RNA polymerase sigma factor (sigma-70 family)
MDRQTPMIGERFKRLYQAGTIAGLSEDQLLDRFLTAGDEAAFEALVVRHAPMVWGVCRRLLDDAHEAEDAFQATFLVLVSKARTIRERDLLAPWLYQIARRVAQRASFRAARRRQLERTAPRLDVEAPSHAPDFELRARLDLELGRLPEKYRAPVVLCYLEGRTHAEAAAVLRWPIGTVKGRLARARALLHARLERDGLAPAPCVNWTLGAGEMPAPVSRALVCRTCSTARGWLAGGPGVGASIQELVSGVSRTMLGITWKVAAAGIVALGLVGANVLARQDSAQLPDGGLLRPYEPAKPKPPGRAPAPTASSRAAKVSDELARLARGRILDSLPVDKDCVVIAYMPVFQLGRVDNLGVENQGGGVRTFVSWPDLGSHTGDADSADRRYYLALYSRRTIHYGPAGPLLLFEVLDDWPEHSTVWSRMPQYADDPAGTFEFAPGEGWKLLDVTGLVRDQIASGRKPHGVLLRFLNEDRQSTVQKWSGYSFVSREATAELEPRRPVLLVVDGAHGADQRP